MQLIARTAADASATNHLQAFVAVAFSAFAIEGTTNDAADRVLRHVETHRVRGDLDPLFAATATALRALGPRASFRSKVDVIVGSASGAPCDWGAQPLQDCSLLFDARDWIAHLRPEEVDMDGPPTRRAIAIALADRGIIPRELNQDSRAYIFARESVARWAVALTVEFARWLEAAIPNAGPWQLPRLAVGALLPEWRAGRV